MIKNLKNTLLTKILTINWWGGGIFFHYGMQHALFFKRISGDTYFKQCLLVYRKKRQSYKIGILRKRTKTSEMGW